MSSSPSASVSTSPSHSASSSPSVSPSGEIQAGWEDLTTAGDLIESALRRIGVLASGTTLTAQEGADALAVLNALIDEWKAHRLTICAQARTVYTLTANVAAYTIGIAATFNQPRPLWYDAITLVQSGLETELHRFLPGEWERQDKTLTATVPDAVQIGTDFSFTTLTFWPIPTTACQVAIYAPQPTLTSIAALGTAISAPPGSWNALRYNLALELAPEFGKAIDPMLVKRAADTLATVKRLNRNMDVLEMPSNLPGLGGSYDINSDTWRR